MNKDKLIPELRFPEFENDEVWEIETLGDLSKEISEKTQGRKFKLMSITSGIGLVSQLEKFGREIAGNSYVNYIVIKNGDFAYNKSSTKLYAEGEIALYEDEEIGAVPNSIFTCFRFNKNQINARFAKYPFISNLHGKWLRKYIAVGARANGALQVNTKDLFSVPFPFPKKEEQQKIASCLSSLDELITAHNQKLEALKAHKKGLMQNLFPQEGETVPKYRFPEFEHDGEWVEKTIGDFVDSYKGGAPLTPSDFVAKSEFEIIPKKAIGEGMLLKIENPTFCSENFYLRNVQSVVNSTYLITTLRDLVPSGPNIGYIVKYNSEKEYILAQGVYGFKTKSKLVPDFLIHFSNSGRYRKLVNAIMVGSTQVHIRNGEFFKVLFCVPPNIKEQQKIASCLSSLDILITAQMEKIEQSKLHKKGLMQSLFPKL